MAKCQGDRCKKKPTVTLDNQKLCKDCYTEALWKMPLDELRKRAYGES